MGHPVSKAIIRPKVFEMCGKNPNEKWVARFLRRHPDTKLGCPSGLDPKRAKAFNYATVKKHFKLLDAILKKDDIPWENMYNMDEKGIQIRGGRKQNGRKYFFSRQDQQKYKQQSADLELITIVECVCADGTDVPPGFVFAGKNFDEEWFEVPGVGW
jgi:hypothetical protein